MARPLGSTLSADRGAPPSLFERFSATISLSDFPPPCIAVVLLSDSQRGPWGHPPGVRGGISRLPCKQLPYVHRVSGPRGGGIVLAISERFHVAFRSYDYVGPPKSFSFRGSIPGPHVPLSMLRLHSYEYTRMTRGQHGSLLLSCERLSLSATHRFAPAHRILRFMPRLCKITKQVAQGVLGTTSLGTRVLRGDDWDQCRAMRWLQSIYETQDVETRERRFLGSSDVVSLRAKRGLLGELQSHVEFHRLQAVESG